MQLLCVALQWKNSKKDIWNADNKPATAYRYLVVKKYVSRMNI